jgi:sugar lactone lactonase YvrE
VNTYATNIEYAYGVAVDTIGEAANVYVSNFGTYQIGHITPSGDMIPLAGNGIGSTNGPGYAAKFDGPAGIAFDIVGNIYVADKYNNVIRKISSSGVVTTFAGDGSVGSDNGVGTTAASFTNPTGVAVDKAGNVYVADQGNNLIRKISPAGAVSWLAGTGQIGSANGPGYAASFNHPSGVAVDDSGNVYVADTDNNMIRKISQ